MGRPLKIIQIKSDLYDEYYLKGQAILDKYNPCNISKDGKTCNGGTPCCSGCRHLGPKGCTTDSLHCKLWLCLEAIMMKSNKKCVEELQNLKDEVSDNYVPTSGRHSKKETFKLYPVTLRKPLPS